MLVDIDGNETPVGAPQRSYGPPAIAPDGARIAASVDGDIWVWDSNLDSLTRLSRSSSSTNVPLRPA